MGIEITVYPPCFAANGNRRDRFGVRGMKDTILYWINPQFTPLPPVARCTDFMTEKEAIRTGIQLSDEGCLVAMFDASERPSLRDWAINMLSYEECCT
jgi:hypothetical protein